MVSSFFFPAVLVLRIAGPEETKNLAGESPPPIQIRLATTSLEKISPARQGTIATSANRPFAFQKRSQLLIRTHNETLTVAAN